MKNQKVPDIEAFNSFIKRQDWTEYAGEWIAICGKKVIANNEKLDKVIKESSKKCKGKVPTFTKIPDKNTAMLL